MLNKKFDNFTDHDIEHQPSTIFHILTGGSFYAPYFQSEINDASLYKSVKLHAANAKPGV